MKEYNVEEIQELIRSGFSKDLIAYELGISIEELNQLTANNQNKISKENIEKRRKQIASKIMQMKRRYHLLYNDSFNENMLKDRIEDLPKLEKAYRELQQERVERATNNPKQKFSFYLADQSELISLELRINRLKNEKMRTELNHPSANIEEIIQQLVTGTLRDVQQAEEVIDSEARKRLQQGNSSKFALTQEQQKQKIFMQICSILKERAEEFHIENPEVTIRKCMS